MRVTGLQPSGLGVVRRTIETGQRWGIALLINGALPLNCLLAAPKTM